MQSCVKSILKIILMLLSYPGSLGPSVTASVNKKGLIGRSKHQDSILVQK